MKTDKGHNVKIKWTYTPNKLNQAIIDVLNPLLKQYKISRANIGGIDASLWGRLLRGERDWSTRQLAQIIGYLKEKQGIQLKLRIDNNPADKEKGAMSEWKELYFEQNEKAQNLEKRVKELEILLNPPTGTEVKKQD